MSIATRGMSRFFCLAMIFAALGGCWRAKPPATAPVVKTAPAKAVNKVAEVKTKPEEKPTSATATPEPVTAAEIAGHNSPGADQQSDVGAVGADAAPPDEAVPSEQPTNVSTERFLLFTPTNPLIVELQLTIDGRPHTEALSRLVEEVLKLADEDGDGRATWKELTASNRIKYGQYGNLAIEGENGHKQIVERYDINRDSLVNPTELPRFLTRNAGGSRAFSIRGSIDYRHTSRRGSPLWKVLDTDHSGELSAEELSAAPIRLLSRDTDDDEILVAADLNPRNPLDDGMMNDRRRRGPEAARLLGENTNWDSVRLGLEENYAGGRYLRPDAFPLTPQLFAQLDANGDGKLLRAEFEALNNIPPHLIIAADFGAADDSETRITENASLPAPDAAEASAEPTEATQSAAPRLRLVSMIPELDDAARNVIEQPGRLTFRLGGTVITFYINDTVAGGDYETRAQQSLTMFDGDKNGYLEESEIPEGARAQLGRIEAIDTDGDGKLYAGEIVAYLKQQQSALRAQIHAKASDREDALFAALDVNRDERLDAREIERSPQQLKQLDRDGDGVVISEEIPEGLMIGLARGSLENADALFAPPPLIVRGPAKDTPMWFTRMDANADGAISHREFLGPLSKFRELDANDDGLLEPAEAAPQNIR